MTEATPPTIGVCLSGGALLYLVDAGKGPQLAAVSSVSGGSMTNAAVGRAVDLHAVSPAEFDRVATDLSRALVTRGTLWASSATYLWVAGLAMPFVAAVLATGSHLVWSWPAGWWVVALWLLAVVVAAVLAPLRSAVAARAFDTVLYRGARLADLHGGVDHVLCATDLQSGEAVYLSNRFIAGWRTGFGDPAALPLATAVQASACLPGAFAPRRLDAAPHRFPSPPPSGHLLLTDGGVYDNMGDEWLTRAARGFDGYPGLPPEPAPRRVGEMLVVNASAGSGITPRGRVGWPLLGELFTLLAVKDVLYEQTTSVRRRWLDLRYRVAGLDGAGATRLGVPGATVQIDRSPLDLPRRFALGSDDRAARARAVIQALDGAAAAWDQVARANDAVGTTLSRIPPEQAASLIRHGYVLTMANTHVLLGYPLLAEPDDARVRRWVT